MQIRHNVISFTAQCRLKSETNLKWGENAFFLKLSAIRDDISTRNTQALNYSENVLTSTRVSRLNYFLDTVMLVIY